MPVLERADLEASPLADLHAIADQIGLEGFRRLRKAELIDAILDSEAADSEAADGQDGGQTGVETGAAPSRSRSLIGRRRRARRPATDTARRSTASRGEPQAADEPAEGDRDEELEGSGRARGATGASRAGAGGARAATVEGVVELLDNGSAFLRVLPPEPSEQDAYISAAQVRRCELVSGDRVSGPVRAPRRSERYPSLIRVDTINGASADAVSAAARYEDLPVAYPSEHLALGSPDPTLEAVEWLTPLGRGSRALIVGAPRAGKTEILRRLLASLSGREDLEVTLLLAGARPEEIAEWEQGEPMPAAALSFAASADAQGQAIERALDSAKRIATRGGDAVVLIDGLDGLHPHTARKVLATARKLRDAGSLTIIATAARPFGGETTVIALDVALTSTGRQPILDLLNSGTLKPELLVGEDGARAITQARAAALEAAA